MSNQIVHGLWIGQHLSKVELLTLSSFTQLGHQFHLWVYEPILSPLPEGIIIRDASRILPRSTVFSYQNSSSMGHGKGSYAGFSDIFRYKLLYEEGGWWVDMDITCLKYFDFDAPYFFRSHHNLLLVGNVMKCPPKSQLMLHCYEQAMNEVDANNTDWHKPIEILEHHVRQLGLEHHIHSGLSNQDQWFDSTSKFILGEKAIPEDYYFIHWQNEAWRYYGLDKNNIRYRSTLAKLMQRHGLLPGNFSRGEHFRNRLYHTRMLSRLRLLGVAMD